MNADAAKIAQLRGFLAEDPDNPRLLGDLADALLQAGDDAEAQQVVDRTLALAPDDRTARYRRAVLATRAGRYDDARRDLETLAAGGEHPVLLYALAEVLFHQQDYETCVATLRRCVALPGARDQAAQADLLLMRALHFLGRLDDAIGVGNAALAEQPQRDDIRAALATLYLDRERPADARRLYDEAAARGAMPAELSCVGGFLALGADDAALAGERFAQALRARPHDGRAWLGAGLAAAARGDLTGATEQLRQAAAQMPTHLGTWNALAWTQLLSGRIDEAGRTLEHAYALDRNFAETSGGLAVVAALKGDRTRAQELIRTALRLDRNSFGAAYAGMLLQHGPQGQQAMHEAAMQFLAKQPAPGGGTLKDAVLRLAQRAGASPRKP